MLQLTLDDDSEDLVDLAGAVLGRQAVVAAVLSVHVLDDEGTGCQSLYD